MIAGAAAGCEVVAGLTDARQEVTKTDASVTVTRDPEPTPAPGIDSSITYEPALRVASLGEHTCAVGPDQRAYCWGDNTEGQLGDGTTVQRTTPVLAASFTDVVDVSAGYTHSCLLRANGDVHCWGKNDRGQLGDGTKVSRYQVADHPSTGNASKVGVGGWHTCVQTTLNGVRCTGDNYYGALGDGTFNPSTTFIDVKGFSDNVLFLGVGVMHNCVATKQGRVLCWGRATFGEVGYLVDGGNGSPDPGDPGSPTPTEVSGALANMDEVAAGEDHSCAIRSNDGAIFCWGRNDHAQFGDSTLTHTVNPNPSRTDGGVTYAHHVAAGRFSSCGIFQDEQVRCWGDNDYAQLGIGNANTGPNVPSPNVTINGVPITNVARISTGQHTCAWQQVNGQAKLYCWGRNDLGQLGIGRTSEFEPVPQEVVFPTASQVDP